MKSVFFAPVYDQVLELPGFLEELKNTNLPCDTVLFFDNGSSDGSEELIRNSGYPYLEIEQNLGVGYSYIVALDWALKHNYDLFGTIATNGKMLPEQMHRLFAPILNGEADYVNGSRFMPGGSSPNLRSFRRISIPLVNRYVQAITGVRLTDATCGYRLFKVDIMKRALFDYHQPWLYTYSFEYYLYAKILLDRNIRKVEVPVTMHYPPKGRRYSKIKPFISWFAMLKPWIIARYDGLGFAPMNTEAKTG